MRKKTDAEPVPRWQTADEGARVCGFDERLASMAGLYGILIVRWLVRDPLRGAVPSLYAFMNEREREAAVAEAMQQKDEEPA